MIENGKLLIFRNDSCEEILQYMEWLLGSTIFILTPIKLILD